MRVFVMVISFAATIWLAERAANLGGIWQSQSFPYPEVSIKFADGITMRGSVKKQWDGWYEIERQTGEKRVFSATGFLSWTTPIPPARQSPELRWREVLPPLLVICLGSSLLFAYVRATSGPKR